MLDIILSIDSIKAKYKLSVIGGFFNILEYV